MQGAQHPVSSLRKLWSCLQCAKIGSTPECRCCEYRFLSIERCSCLCRNCERSSSPRCSFLSSKWNIIIVSLFFNSKIQHVNQHVNNYLFTGGFPKHRTSSLVEHWRIWRAETPLWSSFSCQENPWKFRRIPNRFSSFNCSPSSCSY